MRYLMVLSVVTLVGGLGSVAGQELGGKPLRMHIKTTATIPRFLDLQAAQTGNGFGRQEARVLSLLIRANCRWVLRAQAVESSTLQQLAVSASAVEVTAGKPVTIPCQVPHFAGEHRIQFAVWPGAGGALRLWVESAEGTLLASPVVTIQVEARDNPAEATECARAAQTGEPPHIHPGVEIATSIGPTETFYR